MLCASAATESVDTEAYQRSTLYECKGQSLVKMWLSHSTTAANIDGSTDSNAINNNGFWIERDTVATSDTNMGSGRNSIVNYITYRVLGVYNKNYNRWFMLGEKKPWGPLMKLKEKKKYKVAVLMVDDGILEEYDYVDLEDEKFELKYICRVIDGNDFTSVKEVFLLHLSRCNNDRVLDFILS